jgi:hypothetical protein
MPQAEYHEAIDASLQTIWRVLLDRIEQPDKYMGNVDSFSFPENTDEYAVREVVINGMSLLERITIDEREGQIRYELLNHPLFEGDVYNELIPPAGDDPKATPIVRFRMDWRPKGLEAQALELDTKADLEESMRQAIRHVKTLAEHMETNPAGTA